MAAPSYRAKHVLHRLLGRVSPEDRIKDLLPRSPDDEPLPPRLPGCTDLSEESCRKRRDMLKGQGIALEKLSVGQSDSQAAGLSGNIESFVGFARIPVGVIGPLRVNGTYAHGDFYVPMATAEGALVASYNRGAAVVSHAGGVSAICLTESVSRAPCFGFANLAEAGQFLAWVLPQVESLQDIVSGTSSHCRLIDVKTTITGKEVYLIFEFTTGDAAGQNMVTIATEAICQALLRETPITPRKWYIEGNMSGDKKATMLSYIFTRGKDVVAEAVIPEKLIQRFLHAAPEDLVHYWQVSTLGGIQSGSIGVQGHYANALAAIFIACGQDAACVSEAAVGLTRMDLTEDGALYVSVKLPNLIVGTVGGGTRLSTARECLEMMGCHGEGRARKFAEICAATALAGELSIIGSMAAGDFTAAHATYGRRPPED